MNKLLKTITFTLLLCMPLAILAGLRLPASFSDHMVLQQNSEVKIWGWCNMSRPAVTITPSWTGETITVKADGNSKWEATLKTPKAGGPYEIKLTGYNDTIILRDVLIGEVWFCSGQSNMVWCAANGHKEMLDEIPNAKDPNIRLLNVERVSAAYPQENAVGSWSLCGDKVLMDFSSVGYFIAKKLRAELGVPVGIISSCWGGTSAEVWVPQGTIADSKLLTQNAAAVKPAPSRPYEPGALWNSMVYPFLNYKVAGVFWYQGESNVPTWDGYQLLFSSMIQDWRNGWGEMLPFYYVQIAPHDRKAQGLQKVALLREQQQRAAALPKTGMVVITDLAPDVTNIHPELKIEVANRLASYALAEVYGKNIAGYKSPVIDRYEIKNGRITVYFKDAQGKLTVKGDKVKEIFIAGEDRVFHPAEAIVKGSTLEVSSSKVPAPVAVRFGFTDAAVPNLFSETGLPVAPFRTDEWEQ